MCEYMRRKRQSDQEKTTGEQLDLPATEIERLQNLLKEMEQLKGVKESQLTELRYVPDFECDTSGLIEGYKVYQAEQTALSGDIDRLNVLLPLVNDRINILKEKEQQALKAEQQKQAQEDLTGLFAKLKQVPVVSVEHTKLMVKIQELREVI